MTELCSISKGDRHLGEISEKGRRWGVPVGMLKWMRKASLMLAQRPKGERVGQGHAWRKNNPGKGTSLCKDPEVEGCLACANTNVEISVVGSE